MAEESRRTFLKGSAVIAGGLVAGGVPGLAAASDESQEQSATQPPPPENPYGSRPGGGISLPDYYRPWAALKNRNFYAPGTEVLPKNEMRISPWHNQKQSL